MAHKVKEGDCKPCWHMRTLVSAWVDGALTGLARRYTEWHVRHCPQCQASIPFLRTLHERLRAMASVEHAEAAPATLSGDAWSAIEEAWEKADEA